MKKVGKAGKVAREGKAKIKVNYFFERYNK